MSAKPKLKKICGDNLSSFLARNFNQDFAASRIRKHFNNNGKDIRNMSESDYPALKNWLNSLDKDEDKTKPTDNRTATEVLSDAGYDLYRVESLDDAERFKSYFREGEMLCKFNSPNTFTQTDVFFIVKRGADKIKPSSNPKRQDDYSTSVMSTKISKDGRNVLQITSRYNHSVPGCDNTHGSNFDNIAEGLTDAFNREFGYKIKQKANMFEFGSFVEIDGTFVHYTHEINGVKIGNNTLVTDRIINYSHDRYYTYDYFVIDLKERKILWEDEHFGSIKDSFVDYFNSVVKRIEFVKSIEDVDDNGSDEICYIEK